MESKAKIKLEEGKSYRIKYKRFPERSNAKEYEMRAQILEVGPVLFERQQVITNHRPWDEGGTGSLYLDQITEATEIPRGPKPR